MRTTPRAIIRRISARSWRRFGAVSLVLALIAAAGCAPEGPQAITSPGAGQRAESVEDGSGSGSGDGTLEAGDTAGADAPTSIAGRLRERIGAGRAVAADSAGSTTVVATTIGVDIVDDGGRRGLPVATMEPADRVALAPDGSTAVIGWSSTTELWSLGDSPRRLAERAPTRWAAITGAGQAVLVSWSDVAVLDATDGAELLQVDAPADRTIGAAAAHPDGDWWAAALIGGDQAELLVSSAAGAEVVTVAGFDGFDVVQLVADPASGRLLIGLSDPVLEQLPELVAFDLGGLTVDWSVPLAFDERWGASGLGDVLVVGSAGRRLVEETGSVLPIDGEADVGVPLVVRGLPSGGFTSLYDDGARTTSELDGRPVAVSHDLDRVVTPLGSLSASGLTTLVDQLGRVEVLDRDGTVARRFDDYVAGRINDVAIGSDGSLALATSAGAVRVLAEAVADAPAIEFTHPEGSVDAVAFSPDSERVVVGVAQRTGDESFDDTVVVWDLGTEREITRVGGTGEDIAGCSSFVNPVDVSADGAFAVGVSHDFTAYLLDGESFESERLLSTHLGPILDVALSPDGSTLVTTSEDLILRVVDVATGDTINEFQTALGGIRTASFLPGGDALLIGDLLGQLQVLDLASGQITRSFEGAMSRDAVPEISPDGKLVAAGDGATLRLWSVATGQVVGDLVGHSGQVNSAAFTQDGAAVISGSTDGTAVVWDLRA